jgi:hypothetical protein
MKPGGRTRILVFAIVALTALPCAAAAALPESAPQWSIESSSGVWMMGTMAPLAAQEVDVAPEPAPSEANWRTLEPILLPHMTLAFGHSADVFQRGAASGFAGSDGQVTLDLPLHLISPSTAPTTMRGSSAHHHRDHMARAAAVPSALGIRRGPAANRLVAIVDVRRDGTTTPFTLTIAARSRLTRR